MMATGICITCRKAWKITKYNRPHCPLPTTLRRSDTPLCPLDGHQTAVITGDKWRAPRKNNRAAWRLIAAGDIWWDKKALARKPGYEQTIKAFNKKVGMIVYSYVYNRKNHREGTVSNEYYSIQGAVG